MWRNAFKFGTNIYFYSRMDWFDFGGRSSKVSLTSNAPAGWHSTAGNWWFESCFLGRLEVCLMGCQDLLESVPGRGRLTGASAAPGNTSEGKSLKVKAGLSGRSTNGKPTKSDELSCKWKPNTAIPFYSLCVGKENVVALSLNYNVTLWNILPNQTNSDSPVDHHSVQL